MFCRPAAVPDGRWAPIRSVPERCGAVRSPTRFGRRRRSLAGLRRPAVTRTRRPRCPSGRSVRPRRLRPATASSDPPEVVATGRDRGLVGVARRARFRVRQRTAAGARSTGSANPFRYVLVPVRPSPSDPRAGPRQPRSITVPAAVPNGSDSRRRTTRVQLGRARGTQHGRSRGRKLAPGCGSTSGATVGATLARTVEWPRPRAGRRPSRRSQARAVGGAGDRVAARSGERGDATESGPSGEQPRALPSEPSLVRAADGAVRRASGPPRERGGERRDGRRNALGNGGSQGRPGAGMRARADGQPAAPPRGPTVGSP